MGSVAAVSAIVTMVAAAASTAITAVQTAEQADAQEKQYRYQAAQARANASFMEQNAKQVEDAGRSAEQRQRVINNQLLGQQRAQAGASGLDVGSDTLVEGFATQAAMGEVDALNVRANYQTQANQYWQQKANLDSQASWYESAADSIDPTMALAGIAASGLGKVAASWYSFNQGSAPAGNGLTSVGGGTGAMVSTARDSARSSALDWSNARWLNTGVSR